MSYMLTIPREPQPVSAILCDSPAFLLEAVQKLCFANFLMATAQKYKYTLGGKLDPSTFACDVVKQPLQRRFRIYLSL